MANPTNVSAQLETALNNYSATAKTTRNDARSNNWLTYTAAAGAALGAAGVAEADVVYSGVQNTMLERSGTSSFLATAIDINGDAIKDFDLALGGFGSNAFVDIRGASTSGINGWMLTNGSFSALRLLSSNLVSSGGNFDNIGNIRGVNSGGSSGLWPGGSPTASSGFLGLAFLDSNSDTHYAWLRLQIRNDNALGAPDKVTIVDWAYESDADTAIHVGTIPEPNSLALLAAGAAGVAAFRRRRND